MIQKATYHQVYLSLGSNLGNRGSYLQQALELLAKVPEIRITTRSSSYETKPWGYVNQPDFLNMAASLQTTLPPEDLLAVLKKTEDTLGRTHVDKWGPRTIDLDILTYDDLELFTDRLKLPHPDMTKRRFVLEPLTEIAPNLLVKGKTVREWLTELGDHD